ncbi:MAG: WYL domain-containing transcriptional regulator [Clostridia bacterium]|nr:WYL domain-containing transcriptional regulator [Clostridia bacterium]
MDKKALPIILYKVLYERTCPENPITYIDLAKIIENEYDLETNRKLVSKAAETLEDLGVEIIQVKNKGVYLASRPLEAGEIKFLIDCICSFNYMDSNFSAEFISKLCSLGGKPFKDKYKLAHRVKDTLRGDNKELFVNTELIDEAISENVKISFDYHKFGADKKLHKTNTHIVSPFYTFLANQSYYLLCSSDRHEGVGFYRIDKIKNIRKTTEKALSIKSFEGFRDGIDIEKLAHSYPYMYSDKPQLVELICNEKVIDDIIGKFGKKIRIKKLEDGTLKVSVMASVMAMEFWLMQYCKYVTVVNPISLVEKVKENIQTMINNYGVKP